MLNQLFITMACWIITVAIEREIEIDMVDNINVAVEIANQKKLPEERIVKIRLDRYKKEKEGITPP